MKKRTEYVITDSEELFDNLLNDYTTLKKNQITRLRKNEIEKSVFMDDVKDHIWKHYSAGQEVIEQTLNMFEQYVFGYHRLTPLIDDPDISDIKCFSFDRIRIKKNGKREGTNITFRNKEEYAKFVSFVATRNNVNISNLTAKQQFADIFTHPDYILRFTLTMPLINTYDEPYLHIRKTARDFPEIEDLIEKGMLTQALSKELIECFRSGSTLICGGNSSGKTTLLNALKETLPEDMDVLVNQQSDELTTKKHPATMFMHSLPPIGESSVSYDLKDISIIGLTMDIDFFIIGEIKGHEALYLLNAADSGQLCAGTIHANSADSALDKIVDYCMQNGTLYTQTELMKTLARCFHTIVFMKNFKVDHVYAINGWNMENNCIEYEAIYGERGK